MNPQIPLNLIQGSRRCILGSLCVLLLAIPASAGPVTRRLQWSITVRNTTGQVVSTVELVARVPLAETPWQRTLKVDAGRPYERVSEPDGGQLVRVVFTNLPPYALRDVRLTASVELNAAGNAQAPDAAWLEPAGAFDFRDAAFARELELARRQEGDVLPVRIGRQVKARICDYVFSGQGRSAIDALQSGQGDCSEQMNLSVAMLRKSGIHARGMGGVVASSDRMLAPQDYHNWAVYHDEHGWGIVDANRGRWGTNAMDYVAFEWVDGTRADDVRCVRRYRVTGPGVTARMNEPNR
jgi:transglutaminase-like putative cysteine protease